MKSILVTIMLYALSAFAASGSVSDPDIQIKVDGLVCSSCAIGIKKGLMRTKLIKGLKIDIHAQSVFVEYWKTEIHPIKIKQIIKKAGYEVRSIKWLKKKIPNRYNKP
jgi:copper chaperone CopZ